MPTIRSNPFIPLPGDLSPNHPDFIAVLNDRLRRLSSGVSTAAQQAVTATDLATSSSSSGTTTTSGGSTATAPADVTVGAITPTYSSLPDAYGNLLLSISIAYTVPSAWTGTAVHVWYEYPDQSSGLALIAGGSAGVGEGTLGGGWIPVDGGQQPYVSTAMPPTATISGLVAPTVAENIRVYLVACSASYDAPVVRANATNPTPNGTCLIEPPSGATIGTAVLGAEYAPNLTSFTATAGASFDRSDGKQVTPITFTFDPPTDSRISKVVFTAIWDDPTIPADQWTLAAGGTYYRVRGKPRASGPSLQDGQYAVLLPTTNVLHVITFYASSEDSNGNINSVVPGVTPSAQVTVGSAAGTIDATKIILSTVANYFSNQAGVFGISNGGVTTALIANLAITSAQLAAAAVLTNNIATGAVTSTKIANANITNALIANGAIGTANIQAAAITTALIANAAITTALIANLAVTDAQIGSLSATKLTAGTISAIFMILVANGVTTTINNTVSASYGVESIRSDDGLGTSAFLSQFGLFCNNTTGPKTATFGLSVAGQHPRAYLLDQVAYPGDAGTELSVNSLQFDLTQVLTTRQTDPGDTTDTTDVAIQFNKLLAVLRIHGLIG